VRSLRGLVGGGAHAEALSLSRHESMWLDIDFLAFFNWSVETLPLNKCAHGNSREMIKNIQTIP
jgi:hypothetical protein